MVVGWEWGEVFNRVSVAGQSLEQHGRRVGDFGERGAELIQPPYRQTDVSGWQFSR